MNNIFKHFKRNSKQILSFMLAFVVFVENPLTVFADSATNESFNIGKPVVINSDSPESFEPDTYTGEPFYFDENGKRIYDSENEELQELREHVDGQLENDYSDIAWTFDEYPLTTMNTDKNPEVSTHIAVVAGAALGVLAIAAAAYGVYLGKDALESFASNQFEPWVRRKYGNSPEHMNTLQNWLSAKAATTFVGMKLFAQMVGEFFGTATKNDNTFNFKSVSSFSDTPYDFDESERSENDLFLKSCSNRYKDYETLYNYYIYKKGYSGKDLHGFLLKRDSSGWTRFYGIWASGSSYDIEYYIDFNEIDYNFKKGYYSGRMSSDDIRSNGESQNYINLVSKFGYPIYNSADAVYSHFKYGTSGGTITSDGDATYNYTTSVTAKKVWPPLQTNFDKKYTPSDTITIPNTDDALERLLSAIYASDNESEVISNINSVWEISKNGATILSPEESYSHLSYVLTAIAASAGASITSEQIDSFISEYYGNYVDGTSARKEEQAEEITDKFIVIDGGGNGGDPDNDDKDKNKYKIAKKLAAAFSAFMVSAAITKDLLDLEENPNIATNIQVETSPSVDPTPDPGTDPSSPSAGEDTNSKIDLSGILSYLKNIVDILSKWANPNTLMDILVSKFDLGSIKSSILSLPNSIADSLGLQKLFDGLELPKLSSNAISSITALPNAIAQELGLPAQFENLGRIIELLPDKLVLGFASSFSGLESVVGALPNALAEILPGVLSSSLPNILSDTFGLVNGFSLPGVLSAIQAALGALPEALTDPLKAIQKAVEEAPQMLADILKPNDETLEEKDDGNGLLENILDILMLLILIIIALLILFMNCLILILRLYQIPASTALFNDNVLKGLEFLKSINIPFPGTTGIGLFELLMSCAYFVLFASVIATLRKKIDKFHV